MKNVTRLLITGSNGLVGQKLADLLGRLESYELLLTSRQERTVFDEDEFPYRQMDITSKQAVRTIVDEFEPHIIINAAAMTNVDACETERAQAWQSNAAGVENLVHAAKLVGAHVIQISTDYVFDGKQGPYDEYERPNPINYYGKTKLAAENIVRTSGISFAIVRTLLLYGTAYKTKPNFPLHVLAVLEKGQQFKAADDQYGNPTLADDVAFAILKIIEKGKTGIYHIAGPDFVSRFEFAKKIAASFGYDKKLILPVKTSALKQAALRPLKSGFITLKADTDLRLKTTTIEQGLMVLQSQIQEFMATEEQTTVASL